MTKSQFFLYLCLSFLAGIFISSIFLLPQALLLGILIFGIFLISVFWNYKKVVIAGFCLLFLAFGIWRYQTISSNIPQIQEKDISFVAIVLKDPDIREASIRLTVAEFPTIKTELRSVQGKILITTWRYPEYRYGDKLEVTGKLDSPPVFNEFNYRDYLKKDGIFAVMSWPKIEVLGSDSGNPVISALFSFKNKFETATSRFLSLPQQGFLEALVFGDESNISTEWKEKLNLTGTRHIAAVSGMNITIISMIVINFFISIGLWRRQAFWASVILLALYILMIGAPASAVRAGVMGGILIFSQYLGRMSSAGRAVVFAATLMLFLNPLLLRFDIGFQLSFLAVCGIIYLQPRFLKWFRKIPEPKIFPLRSTLAATFAAQVFTMPILIFNFGYIPVLSPVINILIVPFLAPLTILLFIFGFSSMLFWPLGYVLSWPAWLSLSYLTSVIDIFSKLPKIW